ncbi:hypothetical protein TL18_03330 [Methanobrevibacter sp. YE315]|uniref:Ig-like domain-containing protein n=1 Tax=Methanobrevibacter sp. YE315 TaxID=1609968 RepID=UPI000764E4D2|nr:Ig-like domain-containing protein [Methanobrevibacter sp. YE315]AMD17136.1 hypothetical protein TL18_03330 [Methanobrevibacter sp. YE315]
MDNNKLIIIVLIAIIAILLVSLVAMMPNINKQETKLTLMNNSISEGDNIEILLSDADGICLSDETINFKLTGEDGVVISEDVTTDSEGKAKLKVEKAGKYSVDCTFKGEGEYSSCSLSENIEVEKATTEVVSESSADNYPEYNPDLGYYRSTGIGESEMKVVELATGRYVVIAGDGYYDYGGQDAQGNIIRGNFLGHGGTRIY